MPTFEISGIEYNISIESGCIILTALDWKTMYEYKCILDTTYLDKFKLIDTIEDLYDFILEGFQQKTFNFELDCDRIIIIGSIDSKYRKESYVFRLDRKKVDATDELNNRMKHFQRQIDELKKELKEKDDMIGRMLKADYIKFADHFIMSKSEIKQLRSIHLSKPCNVYIITFIYYDEPVQKNVDQTLYVAELSTVTDMLKMIGNTQNIILIVNLPELEILDIIPENIKYGTLVLISMNRLQKIVDLKRILGQYERPAYYILESYNESLNLRNLINNNTIFIDINIKLCSDHHNQFSISDGRNEHVDEITGKKYQITHLTVKPGH